MILEAPVAVRGADEQTEWHLLVHRSALSVETLGVVPLDRHRTVG
jgi:hypothetical protein